MNGPLLASVLLSLVSAVAYAGAAIVQERIASTTPPGRWALLRRGRWWVSVGLNGSGAALHVAALGLGPLTVVQPLGVLTIVVAAPLAALTVGRPVGPAGRRGIALVALGLAGVLICTGARPSRPLGTDAQYAVAGVAAAGVAALVALAVAASRRREGPRSLALATAAGLAFGAASVCVKAVAEGWALTSVAAALPVLGLIALFATTGLATAQASYRGGGLAVPLATTTVANPVFAAGVGLVVLDEGFRFGAAGGATALSAAVLTVWGLVVLTRDSAARRAAAAAPAVIIPSPGALARPGAPGPLPTAVTGERPPDRPLPAAGRSAPR
jgi:drug/metabolite transporter (DMT)-like permease